MMPCASLRSTGLIYTRHRQPPEHHQKEKQTFRGSDDDDDNDGNANDVDAKFLDALRTAAAIFRPTYADKISGAMQYQELVGTGSYTGRIAQRGDAEQNAFSFEMLGIHSRSSNL